MTADLKRIARDCAAQWYRLSGDLQDQLCAEIHRALEEAVAGVQTDMKRLERENKALDCRGWPHDPCGRCTRCALQREVERINTEHRKFDAMWKRAKQAEARAAAADKLLRIVADQYDPWLWQRIENTEAARGMDSILRPLVRDIDRHLARHASGEAEQTEGGDACATTAVEGQSEGPPSGSSRATPPPSVEAGALSDVVRSREIAWNALDELASPDSATAEQMKRTAREARDASAESASLTPTPEPPAVRIGHADSCDLILDDRGLERGDTCTCDHDAVIALVGAVRKWVCNHSKYDPCKCVICDALAALDGSKGE